MAIWCEKEINKNEEESSLELLSSCLVPKVKQNNQLLGGDYFSSLDTTARIPWMFALCRLSLMLGVIHSVAATEGEAGGQASLFSWHSYIGIPINFHEESGIVTIWSIELSAPLEVQMDVRPSVQKRLRTMALSRISTGDSNIHSSCEMKDEPAFKALQGNPAFLWVTASRCPLYLMQKTQSRSHIAISEGRLLLRCLWKAGLPLQSKTGNHSHPQTIWGARKFPQAALM